MINYSVTHIYFLICYLITDLSTSPPHNMDESPRRKFEEDKHFKLELQKDFPPVHVNDTNISFSTDKDLSIDPGKVGTINSEFYIHQDGTYIVNFELTSYTSSLMMLPAHSSQRTIGPHFKLINYSQYPVAIPANKKIFRATLVPIDDVDIYQDLPLGSGRLDMEECEKDIYSLNYVELKDFEDRQKATQKASEVIAEAVKIIIVPPKASQAD